jgi:hypothetical protein
MFYKTSTRSTLVPRHPAVKHSPPRTNEDHQVLDAQLLEANRRAESLKNPKLSNFEKELFQAWFAD